MLIKVGIFDDHEIVRAGFREVLGGHNEFEVICEAGTGRTAIAAIREYDLHIAIVDLALPDLSGMDVLRQAKISRPQMAVLIVSGYSEDQYGINVLRAGADGFISKNLAPTHLVAAVRMVASGHRYVSPALAEKLADGHVGEAEQSAHLTLSEREFQIFTKLVVGRSISDIGQDLNLSPKTVSTYRARLLDKMKFRNNAELTRYAMRHNLIK